MKKQSLFLIVVLMLSVLPGCRISFPNCPPSCGWVPFSIVTVTYPTTPVTTIDTIMADGNGCVVFNSRGIDCSRIFPMGRRRGSSFGLFSAAPDTINLVSPPSTMTIYGYGISAAYGMPKVEYIDQYGRGVSATIATAVGGDGSWLEVNVPDLSHAYSGQFQVLIVNKTWDGGDEEVGYAVMNMWGRDRVDGDGDGWFIDEDCDDSDPSVNPLSSPDCSGLYFDRNCNGWSDSQECSSGSNPCGNQYLARPIDPIEPCYIY